MKIIKMNINKNKNEKKDKTQLILFYIAIFIFFFVFFAKIYPIIIFDTDDWSNASMTRKGIPVWKEFNPIKVLPETMMKIVTKLSSTFILPFNHDFIQATTIMYSITVALFIVLYVYFFMKLLKHEYDMNNYNNILITILFLLCHFLIFRSATNNNTYMFYSLDATTYFHYLIPALLNCSLVMCILCNKSNKNTLTQKSILFMAVYFAIFSNILHSIILATYISSILIIEIIKMKKNKVEIKKFIKNNYDKLLILLVWGISQIFELNGGRANSINTQTNFIDNLNMTLINLGYLIKTLNKPFILFLGTIIITSIILLIKDKEIKKEIYFQCILSGILTMSYLILVCAYSFPLYITRSDTIFGVIFYVLIAAFLGLGYIIKTRPKTIIIMPVVIIILFTFTDTLGKTYRESNIPQLDPENCIAIDNYIINQIVSADEMNIKEIDIYIPRFNTEDNWPIATYSNGYVDTLYDNRIIKNKIKVRYIIDENVNKELIK